MELYLDRPLIETLKLKQSKARTIETVLAQNPRLLLYLPFKVLEKADFKHKTEYVDAWLKLLNVQDVRENFNLGDVYEVSARKNGLEYVVKAVHLIPYFLKYNLLKLEEIENILEQGRDDAVLTQGIAEALSASVKLGIIQKKYQTKTREREEPLFNSEKRKKWLLSLNEKTTPGNLTENFLDNLRGIDLPVLKKDEILIIGGSRLKGYGRENSDVDFYLLSRELNLMNEDGFSGSIKMADPRFAHLVFNTAWYGEEELVRRTRQEIKEKFYRLEQGSEARKRTLERLEQDLLQYRLMHRFHAFNEGVSEETKELKEIDGASAFYDERYREIATELFLNYVDLPTI